MCTKCKLYLASLRSEEVRKRLLSLLKQYVVMETFSCHGNDVICKHAKFHLHACYRLQLRGDVPEAIFCCSNNV